ncbi:MAG: DUF2093 domain-containing protein [Proteobacteria bacterium]|nr:DUF2093 domain-containing protein [Pseudomonadota bacterium]MCH8172057.1 DUF2093 domain-containing protein [Pseudomonadota bacterium]
MKGFTKLAKVRYEAGNFEILEAGDYVLCAVTGETIPLAHLRYWSVERQEAYATPQAAMKRHQEVAT